MKLCVSTYLVGTALTGSRLLLKTNRKAHVLVIGKKATLVGVGGSLTLLVFPIVSWS